MKSKLKLKKKSKLFEEANLFGFFPFCLIIIIFCWITSVFPNIAARNFTIAFIHLKTRRESKLFCLTSLSMNALEWNGNHETSSLHKEEVVLQACQIKEWHHIIFVNADSSSSIIRQTWKVLFSYHMVRHHFPFINGASSACLSRSPDFSTVGNFQKLRIWDRKNNHLYSLADLFKLHITKPLAICLYHKSEKIETLYLYRKEVTCHHFQTSVAIFVYKGETLWEI